MVDYRAAAVELAQKYGLDPNLFVRQIQQESGFNPEARSPAGALGLAQLMPGTALDMGVMRIDPMQNLEGGAKYMRMLLDRYNGDYPKALAAYNAGMGNVDKYGGIPPFKETQNYVSTIFGSAPMGTQPGNTQQGGPAVDQYAQQPQQKGILSYLTDPEKRAKLGLVLSSLASTPNAGVQQMLTNKIAGFEDARTQNKTVQFLQTKGRPDLAQAVASGMLSPKDAVAEVMKGPGKRNVIEVNGKLVDADTGDVVYDSTNGAAPLLTDAQSNILNGLRDDATSAATEFNMINSAYSNIKTFYANPSSVSDYALTVAFAKILDPASVVKEGEQAAIAGSGAIDSTIRATLANVLLGTGQLPPEVRDQIVKLSEQLYQSKIPTLQSRLRLLSQTATAAGIPENLVYPDIYNPTTPGITTTPLPGSSTTPPPPGGQVPGSVAPYLPSRP
jgi:hypothetical protein